MGPWLSHPHILCVLGTGILAHGWSPHPDVSPSSLGKQLLASYAERAGVWRGKWDEAECYM